VAVFGVRLSLNLYLSFKNFAKNWIIYLKNINKTILLKVSKIFLQKFQSSSKLENYFKTSSQQIKISNTVIKYLNIVKSIYLYVKFRYLSFSLKN
jgi:hypothetical protein